MRVPNLGETDLLVPLHDGMFEAPMWQTFLARLRGVSGADYAGMVLHSAHGGAPIRLASTGGDWPRGLGKAFAGWPAEGDLPQQTMREGRVYSLDELRDLEPGLLADFAGQVALRAMRLTGAGGVDARVMIASRRSLGADIASLLAALAPHLKAVLRVFARLEQARARTEISSEAFARINFGWISLDARGCIVDCDQQAERMLQRSSALRRGPYDRLTPSSAAVDRQLAALLRSFASDRHARPRAINLSHDPWIDILVAPLRIEALAGGTEAVAVVYIRGDRSSSSDRAEQLVDLFDLTPSEARMAWSMAQGLSIAEAAKEHGLTIETARNYSKKIYGKTGARGQVDLVRHVLTGVLALA